MWRRPYKFLMDYLNDVAGFELEVARFTAIVVIETATQLLGNQGWWWGSGCGFWRGLCLSRGRSDEVQNESFYYFASHFSQLLHMHVSTDSGKQIIIVGSSWESTHCSSCECTSPHIDRLFTQHISSDFDSNIYNYDVMICTCGENEGFLYCFSTKTLCIGFVPR